MSSNTGLSLEMEGEKIVFQMQDCLCWRWRGLSLEMEEKLSFKCRIVFGEEQEWGVIGQPPQIEWLQ